MIPEAAHEVLDGHPAVKRAGGRTINPSASLAAHYERSMATTTALQIAGVLNALGHRQGVS